MTLKQRATNKQIQILDSLPQPTAERKKLPTTSLQATKQASTKKIQYETQTEMTTSTQQPQTFSSGGGSNTNSHATDDEKVGP